MSEPLKLSLKAIKEFATVRASPHARSLGIKLVEARGHEAWVKLPYDPRFIGNPETGVIHGGVMTALLDNVCATAVLAALGTLTPIATLDLRIDYMRPATPGKDVIAHGACYKAGQLIAFTRGTAYHDSPEDPIATAAAAFMIVGFGGKGAKGTSRPAEESALAPDFALSEKGAREPAASVPEERAHVRPRQGRSVAALQGLIEQIPYARFLGLTIERKGAHLLTTLPFERKLIGNPLKPALHGGVIGAFLEMTALMQLIAEQASAEMPKTIDINIDYLRFGRPVDTFAHATVTRLGRRVANVRAEAWQEAREKPIAALHGHFAITPVGDGA